MWTCSKLSQCKQISKSIYILCQKTVKVLFIIWFPYLPVPPRPTPLPTNQIWLNRGHMHHKFYILMNAFMLLLLFFFFFFLSLWFRREGDVCAAVVCVYFCLFSMKILLSQRKWLLVLCCYCNWITISWYHQLLRNQ